jgi:hypothetical protein
VSLHPNHKTKPEISVVRKTSHGIAFSPLIAKTILHPKGPKGPLNFFSIPTLDFKYVIIEWQKDHWQTITRGSDTGCNYNFDNLQCHMHYLSGNNHFVRSFETHC